MTDKMSVKDAIKQVNIMAEEQPRTLEEIYCLEKLISIAERAGDVTTLWKIGEMTSDKAEEVSRWLLTGEGKDGGGC